MLVEKIIKKSDGYYVTSEDGEKNLGGPYKKIEDAERRLGQVEYFKNKGKLPESKKLEAYHYTLEDSHGDIIDGYDDEQEAIEAAKNDPDCVQVSCYDDDTEDSEFIETTWVRENESLSEDLNNLKVGDTIFNPRGKEYKITAVGSNNYNYNWAANKPYSDPQQEITYSVESIDGKHKLNRMPVSEFKGWTTNESLKEDVIKEDGGIPYNDASVRPAIDTINRYRDSMVKEYGDSKIVIKGSDLPRSIRERVMNTIAKDYPATYDYWYTFEDNLPGVDNVIIDNIKTIVISPTGKKIVSLEHAGEEIYPDFKNNSGYVRNAYDYSQEDQSVYGFTFDTAKKLLKILKPYIRNTDESLKEDFKDYLNIDNAIDEKEKCISLLKSKYGQCNPNTVGALYLLPDGSLIKVKDHSDIDNFLVQSGFIKVLDKEKYRDNKLGSGSMFMDFLNCPRLRRRAGRDSWLLPYIILPEKDLTNSQYQTLEDWVESVLLTSKVLDVETVSGESKVFRFPESSTTEVIRFIAATLKGKIKIDRDESLRESDDREWYVSSDHIDFVDECDGEPYWAYLVTYIGKTPDIVRGKEPAYDYTRTKKKFFYIKGATDSKTAFNQAMDFFNKQVERERGYEHKLGNVCLYGVYGNPAKVDYLGKQGWSFKKKSLGEGAEGKKSELAEGCKSLTEKVSKLKDVEQVSVQELRDAPVGSIIKVTFTHPSGKKIEGENSYKKISDEEWAVLDENGEIDTAFNNLANVDVYYSLQDFEDCEYQIDDGVVTQSTRGNSYRSPLRSSPYERTRSAVYATGNKWAIDNWRATHESLIEKVSPEGYAPKQTGKAYKVFKVKNGKLYPPMVANAGGADTPIGVWLDAEEGEFAGLSKTGRPQVKSTGSGNLAYRPGWHLGDVPRAPQFDRKNKETGEMEFPADFVWAECDYAMDVDYQPEADERGYMRTKVDANGNVSSYRSDKYQHSLAGLPKLPTNGYYKYRTNPRPDTVPWVITGQMKVNRILSDDEVNEILKKNGIAPIHRQGGDKTLKELGLKEGLEESMLKEDKIKASGFKQDDYSTPVETVYSLRDGEGNMIAEFKTKREAINGITPETSYIEYEEFDPETGEPWISKVVWGKKIEESMLKEDKKIWGSDSTLDYYYNADIEELRSELEDRGVDPEEYADWSDEQVRDYFVQDDYNSEIDYEDFKYNILPNIDSKCYADILVLFGDAANWRGTRGATKVLHKAEDLMDYVYPNFEATTDIFEDETGTYYTQSTHDTPTGGTKMYLYSLKSEEDLDKLTEYLTTPDGWFDPEYDYAAEFLEEHTDYNDIKELINKGILTPIKDIGM